MQNAVPQGLSSSIFTQNLKAVSYTHLDVYKRQTVKLVVARAIDAGGLLVLNADDPVLVRQSALLACPLGWFALDFDQPLLVQQRQAGRPTCGVRGGRLLLQVDNGVHDLGEAVSYTHLDVYKRQTPR